MVFQTPPAPAEGVAEPRRPVVVVPSDGTSAAVLASQSPPSVAPMPAPLLPAADADAPTTAAAAATAAAAVASNLDSRAAHHAFRQIAAKAFGVFAAASVSDPSPSPQSPSSRSDGAAAAAAAFPDTTAAATATTAAGPCRRDIEGLLRALMQAETAFFADSAGTPSAVTASSPVPSEAFTPASTSAWEGSVARGAAATARPGACSGGGAAGTPEAHDVLRIQIDPATPPPLLPPPESSGSGPAAPLPPPRPRRMLNPGVPSLHASLALRRVDGLTPASAASAAADDFTSVLSP